MTYHRPMDFANILEWFERHSSNPLGTPFYSDDTPQELAEAFAESFGIDWTPENVECRRCRGSGEVWSPASRGRIVNEVCPDCNGTGRTLENVETPAD